VTPSSVVCKKWKQSGRPSHPSFHLLSLLRFWLRDVSPGDLSFVSFLSFTQHHHLLFGCVLPVGTKCMKSITIVIFVCRHKPLGCSFHFYLAKIHIAQFNRSHDFCCDDHIFAKEMRRFFVVSFVLCFLLNLFQISFASVCARKMEWLIYVLSIFFLVLFLLHLVCW